jgi:hypothetical protein
MNATGSETAITIFGSPILSNRNIFAASPKMPQARNSTISRIESGTFPNPSMVRKLARTDPGSTAG